MESFSDLFMGGILEEKRKRLYCGSVVLGHLRWLCLTRAFSNPSYGLPACPASFLAVSASGQVLCALFVGEMAARAAVASSGFNTAMSAVHQLTAREKVTPHSPGLGGSEGAHCSGVQGQAAPIILLGFNCVLGGDIPEWTADRCRALCSCRVNVTAN